MENVESELQRLRLWVRAYAASQPTAERQRGMGEALARYLRAARFRSGYDGSPLDPIAPIRRIDEID